MRIQMGCMVCLRENGTPGDWINSATLEDSGLYKMTCDRGHESVTCLQHFRFQMLYELAVYAIVDGYYREAVNSFAACLERFCEFYVRLQCERRHLDYRASEEAWGKVPHSERQLGAYVFVHLLETGAAPGLLRHKTVSFRNQVIHNGKMPSRQEAIEFGEEVAALLRSVLQPLRQNFGDDLVASFGRFCNSLRDQVTAPNVQYQAVATMIQVLPIPPDNPVGPSLQEWLITAERIREGYTGRPRVPIAQLSQDANPEAT